MRNIIVSPELVVEKEVEKMEKVVVFGLRLVVEVQDVEVEVEEHVDKYHISFIFLY